MVVGEVDSKNPDHLHAQFETTVPDKDTSAGQAGSVALKVLLQQCRTYSQAAKDTVPTTCVVKATVSAAVK
jgi:hypothetical protein